MRDVNRRTVVEATTATIAGLTLVGTVPSVSADQHKPPAADEVSVEDENVEYIEANPDAGFQYPYFLYTPPSLTTSEESPRPILIEPNNIGSPSDDFTAHLNTAKDLATGMYPRDIAERVGIPLLVPAFPRYMEEPQPYWVYVQALDPDTFKLANSPLERVDLQLLAMVDDARSRLEADGYAIASQVHINGFSASGTFTNRFTIVHPERVNAASSGGNHALTLPKTEIDDDVPVVGDPKWNKMSYPVGTGEKELPYPIGVANLEALTGSAFNREAWLNTPQYIYVGSEDDPVPADGAKYKDFYPLYTKDQWEERSRTGEWPYGMPDLIDAIHGVKSIEERWEVSRAVYNNVGAEATFTIYEGYGHTPTPAMDDLVEFHRTQIEDTYGSTSTNESSPGFGLGATLSGIAGAGYMLKRRVESDS